MAERFPEEEGVPSSILGSGTTTKNRQRAVFCFTLKFLEIHFMSFSFAGRSRSAGLAVYFELFPGVFFGFSKSFLSFFIDLSKSGPGVSNGFCPFSSVGNSPSGF